MIVADNNIVRLVFVPVAKCCGSQLYDVISNTWQTRPNHIASAKDDSWEVIELKAGSNLVDKTAEAAEGEHTCKMVTVEDIKCNFSVFGVSINDATDGSIEISHISGGMPPYQYRIDDNPPINQGVNDPPGYTFKNLGAGKYRVSLLDSGTREKWKMVSVDQPDKLTAGKASTTGVSVKGYSDGAISLEPPKGGAITN